MFKPRYPHLCSPLKVGPLTLRNRMASAPTSLATLGPGGHPSLENIAYYELRAKGGACIVTMGDVIVHGTGLAHPEAVLLTDPDVLPALVPLAEAIRRHGAVASIQLNHVGAMNHPGTSTAGALRIAAASCWRSSGGSAPTAARTSPSRCA